MDDSKAEHFDGVEASPDDVELNLPAPEADGHPKLDVSYRVAGPTPNNRRVLLEIH